ncbi:MAG: helix-turn-helix domain-containing protein [Geminicoccaceae bacterium]
MSRRAPSPEPALDTSAQRLIAVGRYLREARQQRGEDLYDVADYLRIKPSYLFALEEGDLSAMPGRAYAMGFLRSYADHLGFDGTEVVHGLRVGLAADAEQELNVRQPAAENRLPSLSLVVLGLVLGGLAYGGWYAVQAGGGDVLQRVSALPGEIGQYAATLFDDAKAPPGAVEPPAASRPAPAQPTVTAAVEPPPEPPEPPKPAPESAPVSGVIARTAPPAGAVVAGNGGQPPAPGHRVSEAYLPEAAAAEPPAAGPFADLVLDAEAERAAAARRQDGEQAEPGTVGDLLAALEVPAAEPDAAASAPASGTLFGAGAADGAASDGRVVLLAREASWIQVQSPARDYVTSRTLEPGDRFVIPDRNDLALWTGNAGGLEIWVDGERVGTLGRSGAVVRDVSLAPDSLLTRLR